MKIKETIRKQKKRLLSLCMIGVFILALVWGQQEAKADWSDPVYVYSQAGNNAIFRVVDGVPRVYFASYGKAASGGTKYRTVGWKIYLRNGGGIQNLTATNGATITKCRRKVPCCSNGGIRQLLFS